MGAPADNAQSQESPADFGTDPDGVATRWISEITLAEKDHAAWLRRKRHIDKLYEQEQEVGSTDVKKRQFALFWSNNETLGPAILARAPQAVVGRRFKDADPVGRICSEVLERSLNFTLDAIDFLDIAKGVRLDFLLSGRGVAWARYVPHMVPGEPPEPPAEAQPQPPVPGEDLADPTSGEDDSDEREIDGDVEEPDPNGQLAAGDEPYEIVGWEEVVFDHVSGEDFLHNPARKWTEVRWVARITYKTRDELIARFGEELGRAIPLDHGADEAGGKSDGGDEDKQWQKAAIYEIWDKPSRKAIWISKSYSQATLDERDDPLGLKDFFPCPRPCLGTTSPRSIMPIPDWTFYQSQLRDIDELTARIGLLTDALKLRGVYAAGGEQKDELANLLTSETNTLVPVDGWAAFAEKGGIKGLIEWVPLDMVVAAYQGCIEARKQLINDVYQITGIADVMRGDVDPDETATATRTKSNWGSLRVRDKQKEMARMARDLLRIAGEIIATKFSPETLAQMTNVQLLQDPAAKQQLQQQLQAQAQQSQMMAAHAQQTGQAPPPPFQPPPDLVAMLDKPTWADVTDLLRNNTLRGFRIDVETDSTIEPNDQDEKQRRIEFVQAIGEYMAHSMPTVQLMPAMLPVITQGLLYLVRGFRVGREMEDVIERALDQLQQQAAQQQQQPHQPQGPNPQVEAMKGQAAMIGAQAKMSDAQTNQFRAQTDRMEAQAGASLDAQRIQMEAHQAQQQRGVDLHMQGQDIAADLQQAVLKSTERRLVRDINDPKPIGAPTP